MRRFLFIIVILPVLFSNGFCQPMRSLTFGLGSDFTPRHPFISAHYSHSLYDHQLYLTGGCAFFNVGIKEPTSMTNPEPTYTRPVYLTYKPNAHQYFISQISIGIQYGSTLFIHPRCSYNFLAGISSLGVGMEAGIIFPTKNPFQFGFQIGYDEVLTNEYRTSYPSSRIITMSLLVRTDLSSL